MAIMKASVVIPVYNQAERLKLVLKAFDWQQMDKGEFEVIIVDDGSNDDIDNVVNQGDYKFIHKMIKLNKNSGRSYARNIGADQAKGEIIVFCDGDRIPDKEFISRHIEAHEKFEEECVVIGKIVDIYIDDFENKSDELATYTTVSSLTRVMRNFNYADCVFNLFDKFGRTNSKIAWLTFLSGNCSIDRSIYRKLGGFDTNFTSWGFEDSEYGYRLCKAGVKYILDDTIVNYHIFHVADRTNSRRDDSYKYFSEKHKVKEVEKLLEFLDGKISLQELERIAEGCINLSDNNNEIFFNPHKFGRRYKINT